MASTSAAPTPRGTGIRRVLAPFQEFFSTGAAGGIVLLVCTAIALAWANSPWSGSYFHLWERELVVGFGDSPMRMSLHHWINDALMALFFFMVGLEIKREMLVGELASMRQAALPIAAAAGGMAVPALIFVAINAGGPGIAGWGIPMATDIAFALGVLALLGPGIPLGLKVFLAALAIVDDIGAVLVIALFYTDAISLQHLVMAGGILALLVVCNRLRIRHTLVYVLLGLGLWLAVLGSGVHATVAGVLLAMTVPARTRIDEDEFQVRARHAMTAFQDASHPEARSVLSNKGQQEALQTLEDAVDAVQSPLMKMEHALHLPVAFLIMPVFALANAGVRLDAAMLGALSWRIVIGVFLGLVVGKAIGITLASWLAVRYNAAAKPDGVSWRRIHGVAWLGGIGFTMSLFVADLAYGAGPLLDSAKASVIVASLFAGAVGYAVLRKPGAGAPAPHDAPLLRAEST